MLLGFSITYLQQLRGTCLAAVGKSFPKWLNLGRMTWRPDPGILFSNEFVFYKLRFGIEEVLPSKCFSQCVVASLQWSKFL